MVKREAVVHYLTTRLPHFLLPALQSAGLYQWGGMVRVAHNFLLGGGQHVFPLLESLGQVDLYASEPPFIKQLL